MDTLKQNIYEDGSYLAKNPTWHEEDAPFKAKYIFELLQQECDFFQEHCGNRMWNWCGTKNRSQIL